MVTFLLTDIFFYIIILSLFLYIRYVINTPDILETWSYVFKNKTGILSAIVLSFFMMIAFLDSIHFKEKIYNNDKKSYVYSSEIKSLLDTILIPMYENT